MLITYISIFFFVFVGIFMTSAIDGIVNTIAMTPFTAVKTVLGDYVCAIYPVAMTTILSISALQCSFECQRVNSCGGFNFRDNGKTCELISANNVLFGVKQGCKYFTRGLGIAPVGSNGSTNVALRATAIQYSTYSTSYASLVVDGSLTTMGCTASVTGIQEWWTVDLGYQRHVNVVQVAGDAWTVEQPFPFVIPRNNNGNSVPMHACNVLTMGTTFPRVPPRKHHWSCFLLE